MSTVRILPFCLIIFLVGCLPTFYLEDLAIVTALGSDFIEGSAGDEIELTFVYFDFEEKQAVPKLVFGKGTTIVGASTEARLKVKYQLMPDKIQLALFGIDSAKHGLEPFSDILSRDPRFTDNISVALSEVTAKEILQAQNNPLMQGDVGQHLIEIIKKNSQHNNFPHVPFNEFLINLKDAGKDPILPMFSLDDKNMPYLSSIALMQGEKYVEKLPFEDILLFLLLKKKSKSNKLFDMEVPIEPFKNHLKNEHRHNKIGISFEIIKGKSNITYVKSNPATFDANIDVKISIVELVGPISLEDVEVVEIMEKELSKQLKDRFVKLLNTFKELQVDPIGFGDLYRVAEKKQVLSHEEWRDLIPNYDVNFNVDVEIINYGEHM